jgi:hypothetical protein
MEIFRHPKPLATKSFADEEQPAQGACLGPQPAGEPRLPDLSQGSGPDRAASTAHVISPALPCSRSPRPTVRSWPSARAGSRSRSSRAVMVPAA